MEAIGKSDGVTLEGGRIKCEKSRPIKSLSGARDYRRPYDHHRSGELHCLRYLHTVSVLTKTLVFPQAMIGTIGTPAGETAAPLETASTGITVTMT